MSIDNKLILENSKKLNVLYVEDDNFLRHTTLKLLLNFFNSVDESIDGINQDAKDLMYESLLLGSVLNDAFDKRDMQKITDYLHSLSAATHKFYNEHRIIGLSEQNQYLKVLSMVSLSIRTGLSVLGIKAKEVM